MKEASFAVSRCLPYECSTDSWLWYAEPNELLMIVSAYQSHAHLTIPHAITSIWGSKGRSSWPGVQGWRSTLAAARAGQLHDA
jgi:hypothetical protein